MEKRWKKEGKRDATAATAKKTQTILPRLESIFTASLEKHRSEIACPFRRDIVGLGPAQLAYVKRIHARAYIAGRGDDQSVGQRAAS